MDYDDDDDDDDGVVGRGNVVELSLRSVCFLFFVSVSVC